MSHRNARLTPFGRRLLVDRVRSGRPVAHVAKEMGVSRQCAHRWINRFNAEGDDGLKDRSSRPHRSPNRTPVDVAQQVLAARREYRFGPDRLSYLTGVPPRTITRILRRHNVPYLRDCDPLTGEPIRASRTTTVSYERDQPGELVHVDVKKLGRIPDGGGWRAHGRANTTRRTRMGFDYVHSMIDDHSRIAYSEVHNNETGATCAGFITRAAAFFTTHNITIKQIMTDNHWSYRHSHAVRDTITTLNATHLFIKPHCPWQNGKVERFNRTLQTEWAYHQIFTNNHERTKALQDFLHHYNHHRPHQALNGHPPITRLSPT